MNILIINLHSALNLGDDGIMLETLRGLRSAYPNAIITLAANDPGSWQKHHDVTAIKSFTAWMIDRTNGQWHWQKHKVLLYTFLIVVAGVIYRLFKIRLLWGDQEQQKLLISYYQAKMVISCGGGNFYAHRPISPGFIVAVLALIFPVLLGKDVRLLPQSIGPIEGKFQKSLMRFSLNHVNQILLREYSSQSFLDKLGVKRPSIVLPDLAFGKLSATTSNFHLFDKRQSDQNTLRIGLTLIDRGAQENFFKEQQAYEETIVALLYHLNKKYRAHFYLFVQCYGPSVDQDDRQITYKIYQQVKQQINHITILDSFQSAIEIQQTYKYMDCIIGTRMHTGIFSLAQSIPVVMIGYQPKTLGIMKLFGLERFCFQIEELNLSQLCDTVAEVIDNKQIISSEIAERYSDIYAQLESWPKYLDFVSSP